MAGKRPFELTVDQRAIQALGRALKAEEDGKALRKELVGELKAAVAPGVSAIEGRLRAIPHRSPAHPSPALGSYLAGRVKPSVRLAGRSTGVSVRIGKTAAVRGFAMAARRLNRKNWRHKVFGKEVWVTQQSPIPGFFDDTLADGKREYRAAVVRTLESMARRVARKV